MESPTVLRRRLGSELRKLRSAAGLSGKEVADDRGWSLSKLSRIESGETGLRESDVRPLLALYGVTGEREVRQVIDLARKSRQRGWWHGYGDALPEWFKAYIGLEADAASIRAFENELVPGILQTEDYARAIMRATNWSETSDEIERRVSLRMQRQELFNRANPPEIWAIIDESVLRRMVGSRETMRDQLNRLAEIADQRPGVTIQVMPFAAGAHASIGNSFSLLSFEDIPGSVAFSESVTSSIYTDKRADIIRHEAVFARLQASSVRPAKSVEWLKQVAREYS